MTVTFSTTPSDSHEMPTRLGHPFGDALIIFGRDSSDAREAI